LGKVAQRAASLALQVEQMSGITDLDNNKQTHSLHRGRLSKTGFINLTIGTLSSLFTIRTPNRFASLKPLKITIETEW
jgi:hypothetical protein